MSVEWYAKGAVLHQPTIFGINPSTGNAMIGGEAGAEAVAPIATLQGYVQEAVRAENAGVMELLSEILAAILDYFPQLVAMSGHDIKINGNACEADRLRHEPRTGQPAKQSKERCDIK